MDNANFLYFINSTFRMLPDSDVQYGRIINILLVNEFTISQQSSILYYLSMANSMGNMSSKVKNELVNITDKWQPAWHETILNNSHNPNVKYFGNLTQLAEDLENVRSIIK